MADELINLPTLKVTQEQADRMLAAWGSVEDYRAWLRDSIIEFVVGHEQAGKLQEAERRIHEEGLAIREALRSQVK